MKTPLEQTQQSLDNQSPLTPLADFRKSGRAPVEMWLVSEGQLFQWLREQGANAGRPKRPNEIRN